MCGGLHKVLKEWKLDCSAIQKNTRKYCGKGLYIKPEGGKRQLEKVLSGRYEIIREIGRGGAGCVYLAHDRHLRHEVAVKKWRCNEKLTERFGCLVGGEKYQIHEVDVLKQMEHPSLPVVYDFFHENGFNYMVLEYIKGVTLADYIKENGTMKQQQAVSFMKKLIAVIEYLHTFNPAIIYRDLKPENIMLVGDGQIKLVDFGTAFMLYGTAYSMAKTGTPGFTAPELFVSGCDYHENSDIYSLGAVFYFVLTGKPPSTKKWEKKWELRKVASWGIRKFIYFSLHNNPEKRCQNIFILKDELMNYRRYEISQMAKCFIKRFLLVCVPLAVTFFGLFIVYRESVNMDITLFVKCGEVWSWNLEFPLTISFFAGVLLILAGLYLLMVNGGRKSQNVRIVKSVCLSDKKTIGLWVLVLFCLILATSKRDGVYAVDGCGMLCKPTIVNDLPIFIRGHGGYKKLIKNGAIYRPNKDIIIEIPLSGLPVGNEVVLKVVVEGQEGVYESRGYLIMVE